MKKGNIMIEPFNICDLGTNSYDCHLGKTLGIYENGLTEEAWEIITGQRSYDKVIMDRYKESINQNPLDAAQHNKIRTFEIPNAGLVIYESVFYLGATQEYTETHRHIPFIEGKSSTGRLSIDIHATAGKGDIGFCGYWTLEISVKQPVKVYTGMPVAQLIYFPPDGKVGVAYNQKKNAKYSGQPGIPVESMMWKNKFFTDRVTTSSGVYIGGDR